MMRRWVPYLAIAALYMALAFVLVKWVRPLVLAQSPAYRDAATQRYSALHQRVLHENNELRRAVLRDSLQQTLSTRRGVFISDLDSATEYVQRVLSRELPKEPQAAIGFISVDVQYGLHPGVPDVFAQTMTITGETAGTPFCVRVFPHIRFDRTRTLAREAAWLGLSGACYFFARYGAPGPQIREWLNAGGTRHFARYNDPLSNTWRTNPDVQLPPNFARQMRRRLPLRGQKCLTGQRDVCAQSVASFDMTQTERELGYRTVGTARLVPGEGSLLASLESAFGPERFSRFWRSDRPFQEAFEQSFGVPLGEWVYEWTAPLGHTRAGPGLGGGSLLLTLLLIGALVGAATWTAQNRRI